MERDTLEGEAWHDLSLKEYRARQESPNEKQRLQPLEGRARGRRRSRKWDAIPIRRERLAASRFACQAPHPTLAAAPYRGRLSGYVSFVLRQ